MQYTHVTIELPGLTWQMIPVTAESTAALGTHDGGYNDYAALLVDDRWYDLVMAKHVVGRPEIIAALTEALALVQAAIDALRTPVAPVVPPTPALNRIDTFIAAALEEFVTDTQNLLTAALAHKAAGDADVQDEIKFWRSQHRAFVKAQHYFAQGVRLSATASGYTIPSASRPGALIHRLYRVGDIWACSCEARSFCWHHALVCGEERGHELADLESRDDGADGPTPPAWMLAEDAQLLTLLAA